MIKPINSLKKFVKGYDVFETNDFTDKFYQPLPSGYPELFFFCTEPTTNAFDEDIKRVFIGFDTKVIPVKSTSQSTLKYISALFHPYTALDVFGLKITDLNYNSSDVERAFGKDANGFIKKVLNTHAKEVKLNLLENKLQKIIEFNQPEIDAVLKEAIEEILSQYDLSVDNLAKKFNCDATTIRRRFAKKLGVSPKDYMRIIRFNKAFKMIDEAGGKIDYDDIVALCNYYDKWHFKDDFKYFTNRTPEDVFSKQDYLILNRIYLRVDD